MGHHLAKNSRVVIGSQAFLGNAMRRVAALIAAAPAVASDAALRGLVLEALREAMENPWKTHGKPTENPWKTHGKPMENPWFTCFFYSNEYCIIYRLQVCSPGGFIGKEFFTTLRRSPDK